MITLSVIKQHTYIIVITCTFVNASNKTFLFFIGVFGQKSTKTDVPYGIHPMFKASAKVAEPVQLPVTPLNERVTNAEAMVLGFTAEPHIQHHMCSQKK